MDNAVTLNNVKIGRQNHNRVLVDDRTYAKIVKKVSEQFPHITSLLHRLVE